MGHPLVDNPTWLTMEPLLLADESGHPLVVPVLKATLELRGQELQRAEEQAPLCLAGEYWGDEDSSSWRFEPECAWHKPATDVVLLAEAHAARPGDSETLVGLRVGALSRVARVVGDRMWFRSFLGTGMTNPIPFERIPLTWERAFGGHDTSQDHPKKKFFEARNPVGRGYRRKSSKRAETMLPNVEDPKDLLRSWGQTPRPMGFGFVGYGWMPRAGFAGTYDKRWEETRKPLLPEDFDLRFMNGAPEGLVHSPYLVGDEYVSLEGVSPDGSLVFRLPGLPAPKISLHVRGGGVRNSSCPLDTVIIDLLNERVHLLWRCRFSVRAGLAGVSAIRVHGEVPELV